jgi:hypothetical protein
VGDYGRTPLLSMISLNNPRTIPREEPIMTTSTTRKLTRFQYAATLHGALAFVALAPATANAQPVGPTGGGCTYTDADGYDIPIDDGQDVFVDGKIVSCRGGTIVVTTAPKAGTAGVRPPLVNGSLPVLAETPKQPPRVVKNPPVLNENVAVFDAQP